MFQVKFLCHVSTITWYNFYSTVTAEYLITTPYQYRVGHNTVAVQLFGPKSCEVEVRLRARRGNVIASASGNFTAGEKGNLTLTVTQGTY